MKIINDRFTQVHQYTYRHDILNEPNHFADQVIHFCFINFSNIFVVFPISYLVRL